MANLDISVDNKYDDPFHSAENQSRLAAAKERMEQNGGTIHDLLEEDGVKSLVPPPRIKPIPPKPPKPHLDFK